MGDYFSHSNRMDHDVRFVIRIDNKKKSGLVCFYGVGLIFYIWSSALHAPSYCPGLCGVTGLCLFP